MCKFKMHFSGTYLNVLDLCRLCLRKDSSLIPVFDRSLDSYQLCEKINVCLTVQIRNEDKVSQNICDSCLTKVNSFYEFRKSAVENQKELQSWLSENEKQLNEEILDLPSKNVVSLVKDEFKTEENTFEDVDESDIDYDSRSASESSCSEFSEESEVLKVQQIFIDSRQVSESVDVSEDRENPGPSTLESLNSQQVPSMKFTDQEKDDSYKAENIKSIRIGKTCEFCGESFTKFKLEIHRRKHTGERPFKCSESGCQRAFTSKGMLSSHRKVHSVERPYVCDHCTSSFKTAIHLRNHIKIHTGEKPYNCDLCDYSCIYKATLLAHRKRHLKQFSVICEICGKGFYSVSDLKDHVSGHTGETPFSCKDCNKKFPNKYFLRKHRSIAHEVPTVSAIPMQCEKCPRLCPDRRTFKSHMRRVHSNNKFECDICGKLINNKSYLIEHMRVHSGEKPFTCKLCGKSFTGRKSMKLHEVVHTGEKKYECDECGKKFTQKSSLNAHKKLHFQSKNK